MNLTTHESGSLLNCGFYTLQEASRLTRLTSSRIRRWLKGYSYKRGATIRHSAPVLRESLAASSEIAELNFLDLMEMRCVHAFLSEGVTWPVLRRSVDRATAQFGDHPLCRHRFQTDGRRIFADVAAKAHEAQLVDLFDSQAVFRRILQPYLHGLEYDGDRILRWWPLGEKASVVLDPGRCLGKPIVARESVPTLVLAQAVRVEGTVQRVAELYEVGVKSVRDAMRFETEFAA
ncbi:MAG: hypothetical protein FD180_3781 [Planctomycetota bacterium]|nr:MAG: hypothetical protein FD180_3781 [Planctomycetota bacterium]